MPNLRPMKGSELKRLLELHDFSQVGMARELEIGERTMRAYISGQLAIPKTIEIAVLCLLQHREKGK